MSQAREKFSILEDLLSLEGRSPAAHLPGDAVSGNEMPVLSATDVAGTYQHVPVRNQGDAAASGYGIPVLNHKDNAGNLQYEDSRAVGQSPGSQNTPVLPFLDVNGHLAFGNLDAAGNLKTTSTASPPIQAAAGPVSTVNGVDTTVATLPLVASDRYVDIRVLACATTECLWTLKQNNNGVKTPIAYFNTGPGSPNAPLVNLGLTVTAGATGVQQLELSVKQSNGPTTDAYGTLSAVQD